MSSEAKRGEPHPEGEDWLIQIRSRDGRTWADYARGTEMQAHGVMSQSKRNGPRFRVVDWIYKETVLIPDRFPE